MPTTRSRNTSSSPLKDRPWHLGNTTVRSPFRLSDALRVLAGSEYNGNLAGEALEAAFGQLLYDAGHLRSVSEGKTGAWNGRKWRAAMYQLGFVTPALVRQLPVGQLDIRVHQIGEGLKGLTGRPYEVTPSGLRLANATSTVQKEECFLRALLAYRVPSPIEKTQDCTPFSPLRIVLKAMLGLERAGLESHVSFDEMASLVQFCKSEGDVPRLVGQIAAYRAERTQAPNKAVFDCEFREHERAKHGNPVKSESLDDYADVNFRYLRATGLVTRARASIALTKEKRREINLILAEADPWPGDDEYLRRLWEGAPLPTDNRSEAIRSIHGLENELLSAGRTVTVPALTGLAHPDLELIRLGLETERRNLREERFARAQRSETGSITELLTLMESRKERSAAYKSEAPAYFEWAVWRVFLAVNSLANKPWEVRQFSVDAEMNPLSPAPSRRPDLLCEFDDYVLVVEVTFTENARQEAAEGEPVRRHVAQVTRHYEPRKPVYGLFLAPRIDTNTAEAFGRGDYLVSDERVEVAIVPLTLGQFRGLFGSYFAQPSGMGPGEVRAFLDEALALRTSDGVAWKAAIGGQVEQRIAGT
jgi:hypothetical protein